MIPVEGRVIAGLDEFMLRTGHLRVVCRVAHEVGGSAARVEREAAETMTRLVRPSIDQIPSLGKYLLQKGLCPVDVPDRAATKEDRTSDGEPRYPDLKVVLDGRGQFTVVGTGSSDVMVWWQDLQLSHPGVRSRVGGLTVHARAGSKTGLSHVFDWAQILELLTRANQLTPIARLLVCLTSDNSLPLEQWNPYLVNNEKVFVAYLMLQRDIDLFSRLVPRLLKARPPLNKAACTELFVAALEEVVQEGERSAAVSSNDRYQLVQQIRELEKAGRKSRMDVGKTSTAWHRAASRMEVLTDLGLLAKDVRNVDDQYRYVYWPTNSLRTALEGLEQSEHAADWLDRYLVDAVTDSQDMERISEVPHKELLRLIERVIDSAVLPTNLYPLDALSLGLVFLLLNEHKKLSLGQARQILEDLARESPDIGRLARGRQGAAAEYISLDIARLKATR